MKFVVKYAVQEGITKSKRIYDKQKWMNSQPVLLEYMMVFVLLLSFAPMVESGTPKQSWNQNYQFENLDAALSIDPPRRRQRDFVFHGFQRTGLLNLIK